MNAMRHFTKIAILAGLAVVAASCGDVARSGRAPVFLVVDSLAGSAGSAASSGGSSSSSGSTGGGILQSDVEKLVTSPAPCTPAAPCPTIFSDSGIATFHLSLKDIGTVESPTSPSSNNQVTINRYHVTYRRADGRNTPGVDVPYGFDGAATVTVPVQGTATLGFELVRTVAKLEAPLVQLVTNPTVITTIAEVTFYGQDVVGNDIQATATIQVDFGNFADR
jgi:hypothetical protein